MAGLPSQDIVTNPAAAAQTALMYGAQTQQALRRSQYLADALRQMATEGGQNIRSPGELAAKLLATAIMQRNNNKGQDALIKAMSADQQDETGRLLAPLQDPTAASAPPALPPPAPAPSGDQSGGLGSIWRRVLGGTPNPQAPVPQAGGPPIAASAPPGPQPAAPMDPGMSVPPTANPAALDPGMSVPRADASGAAQPAGYTPQDRDALTQMLAKEAIGEGAPGMTAAAHVALNRLKNGYGGAKSLADVIYQPHQFEGMTRGGDINPRDYAAAQQVADSVLSGQTPDPTNGAMAFLNPDLQTRRGGRIPNWAQGQGQRIGNHVFFGGQAAPPQGAGGPPQQAPQAPQDPNGPQGQPPPQPYQVASAGPTPPPPSAPGSSPPAVGMPPAAPPPPQASSAQAGGNPQWPTWKPSPEEYHYVQGLLMDPRTHASGVQEALKMREKMTQKVPAKIIQMNGLSFYVPDEPGEAPTVAIPVPKEARTQTLSAQAAGIAAPPGTTFDTDPLGNHKQVYQPQNGQMITSAPGGPYQEAPIPGGTNDPRAPQAQFSNEEKLRNNYEAEIKPYIAAREGYQKVIQAANTATPAGDIAMVFGYMKTLDPTSTVREGEQAQVNNSGTIPQTVVNMYNKLITGDGRLTQEQRSQFSDSARRQFEVYQRTADALNERYGGLAQSYGFEPTRVVRKFQPIDPYVPPGSQDTSGLPRGWSQQLPKAQLQTAMRFKGATAQGGSQGNPRLVRSQQEYNTLPAGSWFIDDDGAIVQKGHR